VPSHRHSFAQVFFGPLSTHPKFNDVNLDVKALPMVHRCRGRFPTISLLPRFQLHWEPLHTMLCFAIHGERRTGVKEVMSKTMDVGQTAEAEACAKLHGNARERQPISSKVYARSEARRRVRTACAGRREQWRRFVSPLLHSSEILKYIKLELLVLGRGSAWAQK
jgi:hypothetical protein